jgi:hypothetical protein
LKLTAALLLPGAAYTSIGVLGCANAEVVIPIQVSNSQMKSNSLCFMEIPPHAGSWDVDVKLTGPGAGPD